MRDAAPDAPELTGAVTESVRRSGRPLTSRMIGIAALWISVLLLGGGMALDRVLSRSVVENFDTQLNYVLNAMIAASEIGPEGEVRFNRPPADQRFLEPYSHLYFQISGEGAETFPSRSLWDRRLEVNAAHEDFQLHKYDSNQFADEPLRILERDVYLPGSDIRWRYQVAQARDIIDDQLRDLRVTLFWSLFALGAGLLILAALQTFYGLWPLRRIRAEVATIRTGEKSRLDYDFPREVEPLVTEINELLEHSEDQAEEARRHAGNLAHALKTPLTVITNAATANDEDLVKTVCREATVMRRQVDHHLARARAIGRRASAQARSRVWDAAGAVQRAIERMYVGEVTIDLVGDKKVQVRVERQDVEEMLGNLIENAAKYGGGRVFVTVEKVDEGMVRILVEDDGPGIPEDQREQLFSRGTRLDQTGKPGTGLGLAIVRDVAEIYGGQVHLDESEDLGGVLVTLSLPAAIRMVDIHSE